MSTRYKAQVVDPDLRNNSHSYAISMVGFNKRVLELGAAAGDVTRALRGRGCNVTAVEMDADALDELSEVADRVIVGDLNDPATLDGIEGTFDAIVAGDVIEHLLEPQRVVNQLARKLAPGGKLVVSLPHIAHADIRLALLQGRFDYSPLGLLDETHIRFFTFDTIKKLVANAGLMMVDVRRVRVPLFMTEIYFDSNIVDPAVVTEIMKDPDALTYQFVFSAVRDDGDRRTADLALTVVELQGENDRLHDRVDELVAAQDEYVRRTQLAEARLVQSRRKRRRLVRQVVRTQAKLQHYRQQVGRMERSTSWRLTRPVRLSSRLLRRLTGRR
jgi:2-polyprenyl-3-methyl-5-hydroxy-6-metoxy-1,4-benzoquinol methylase